MRNATKFFSLFVYVGVFAFQIWIAERVLATIFSQQGREAWKLMINEANIAGLRDHYEGLCRELLKEETFVIQGDAKRHDVLKMAGIAQARGICIVIDNDADNLYITVTARSLNPNLKIITRAGQQRYAEAIRNSGANEVIIPEYEGGLIAGRMIEKYHPVHRKLE